MRARRRAALRPPGPQEGEVVIVATHVAAPSGATRYPDLYGEPLPERREPDEQPPFQPRRARARARGRAELELGLEDDERGRRHARAAAPRRGAADLTPQGRLRGSVTDDPDFHWRLPSVALLKRSTAEQTRPDTAGQEKTAARLIEALGHFGVEAKIVGTVAGPHITRFELRLAPGIKMSKVAQLKDDLAYALAATDIRILAPIPGKTAVGVEVPNARRRIVQLGDVFQDAPAGWSPLTIWLGKDVAGKAIGADLAKMPHLLVAGTTGAGKSACINAMLSSVLLRATPHELRLVLIDPKQVELNHYESIPHLLTPVITSPRMAANALQNLVREMEQRYSVMSLAKTRSLIELNRSKAKRGEPPLPYILCVIDELADLMMVAPADVEDSIIRLAQKARAVGIHLVLATQSPRVDVITGMIKANVPSRIAFSVSSQTDSRVILDVNGAESLLGQGDMLFSPVGSSRLQRIQGAYIDEPQIEALTTFWRKQGEPEMREDLLDEVVAEEDETAAGGADEGFSPDEDPLLEDAIRLCVEMGTASTSMLQRRLRLGYTRAGRLIDMLERRSVISGYEGSKPRQVLVGAGDVERVIANLRERGGDRRRRCGGGGGRRSRRARCSPRVASGRWRGTTDAGHRGIAARGAHARADRRLGDRGADEDPREVPARAGERGVGPAAGSDVRQELPAHVRRGAGPRRQAARRRVQAAPRAPQRGRAAADQRRGAGPRAPPPDADRAAVVFVVVIFAGLHLHALPARPRRRRRRPARRRRPPRRRRHDAAGRAAAAAAPACPRACKLRIGRPGPVNVCLKAGERRSSTARRCRPGSARRRSPPSASG